MKILQNASQVVSAPVQKLAKSVNVNAIYSRQCYSRPAMNFSSINATRNVEQMKFISIVV
jgi:hypothetical protein